MRQLLLVPPSEIKLQKRQKSVFTPVRQFQLLGGLFRMFKFVFGEGFSELLQAAFYRLVPCMPEESEDASLTSSDSREMAETGLQRV